VFARRDKKSCQCLCYVFVRRFGAVTPPTYDWVIKNKKKHC
jgi:hypothetical protein